MQSDPTHAFALNDPDSWTRECVYIEKIADSKQRSETFIRYCQLRRDQAAERGFNNARVRIQQVINGLQRT